jgi:hypothetical protein
MPTRATTATFIYLLKCLPFVKENIPCNRVPSNYTAKIHPVFRVQGRAPRGVVEHLCSRPLTDIMSCGCVPRVNIMVLIQVASIS